MCNAGLRELENLAYGFPLDKGVTAMLPAAGNGAATCCRPYAPTPDRICDRPGSVSSIRFECLAVVQLQRGILLRFLQHAIADHEHIELVAHEAAEGIFRRAHDRLAADVETGVDQYGASGQFLEAGQQAVE